MSTLLDVLKSLFGKIADFFGVLDLSYFLSGAVCLSALLLAAQMWLIPSPPWMAGTTGVVAVVVACYVLGIVCDASARVLRNPPNPMRIGPVKWLLALPNDDHQEGVNDLLRDHGLENAPPFQQYLKLIDDADAKDRPRICSNLYTLLWAKLRENDTLKASYNLVLKYWVLAAAYSGLGFALLVWTLVVVCWPYADNWRLLDRAELAKVKASFASELDEDAAEGPSSTLAWIAAAALLVLARACWQAANRMQIYQARELVATIAHAHHANGQGGQGGQPPPASSSTSST